MRLADKLEPDEVSIHYRLARLDHKLGNNTEADAEFVKVHSLIQSDNESVLKEIMTGPPARKPGRQPVLGQTNP